MDKYIIVKVFCNKLEIVNNITNILLNNKLVAGCQVYTCDSMYHWNQCMEHSSEYLIEMRTKLSKFNDIEKIVKKIHDYEVCEISYIEISGANKEFLSWIDENVK